jgi:hypothetical protein
MHHSHHVLGLERVPQPITAQHHKFVILLHVSQQYVRLINHHCPALQARCPP